MSKFTPVAITLAGIGGISGSYYLTPKQNSRIINSKVKVSFRNKYKFALLPEGGDIWERKLELIKKGKPTHLKLKEIAKNQENQDQLRKLHKQACEEIYDYSIIASPYVSDFKNYCSQNNKEGIGGAWITEDISNPKKKKPPNEWDDKLTKLKNADKKGLQGDMLQLNIRLNSDRKKTQWTEEDRKQIKEWCDAFGDEIFFGQNRISAQNAKQYCTK
ncbi:hypothetical protein MHC_01945 [Mycoplasma haemocanis str. Illinois]|uniref:Uncharacterized protein n=1 Tax=Mycoplasma haemocanis (strain Illinois) TaxID=1111676 RepID=H6N6I3_MYCHN|nr:hypothetical protein [Mycoplasma haemocanis]AEW45255.1 hypothetical protein MHC_01945 [Mycoplasma haemocanis str. Illinois]